MLLLHLLAQATLAIAAPEAEQGVISYPVSFFAAQFPANAEEMIARVPGFTLDSGASVRGYDQAAGNVLIDGQRPSTKTDALAEILRRIPADQVERIDVIRGGAPGVDMQGKAVIANVIRKKTGGVHGVAALALNYAAVDKHLKPQLRIEGSGDGDGRHWEASARYAGFTDGGVGDGALRRTDGVGQPLLRGGVDSQAGGGQSILAGVYERPAWGGTLHGNARLLWEYYRLEETDDVSLPAPFLQHDQFGQDRFTTEVGGRYTHDLGAHDSLETVALRQSERRSVTDRFDDSEDRTAFAADNDTAEAIVRGVIKHHADDRLLLEGGGEGAVNSLDARQSLSRNGEDVALPAANVRVEEKRWEAFGKASWQVRQGIHLEAAVREEGSNISSRGDVRLQKSFYFTKPRIALSWDIDPKTQVRLGYERVVGQLNFNDFVASSSLSTGVLTAGNPDLNPEQDWVSEAAIERRFLKAGDVSFTYRHSEIRDAQDRAPVFSPDGVFDAPANIGEGRKDEYILQATVPLDRVGVNAGQLRGVSAWRRSRVVDPTTGDRREISGLNNLGWDAHFSQDVSKWRLTWGADVFGQWRGRYYRFNEIETRKFGTFVSLYAEWKPRPKTSLRIQLNDVTGREATDTVVHYAGPRSTEPVEFAQVRDLHTDRQIFFRIRRTFD